MLNTNILSLVACLCLTISAKAAPQAPREKRQVENNEIDFEDKVAEIRKFHVNSKIQLRYAITDIETQMQNRHSEAKEVFFDMYIPKEAFVSNFTMNIKGKTYQAAVKTKEVAKQIYDESTDTSGLLQTTSQPEFTDGKQVTFSAKLDPAEKVTFNLRYEELLQRSEKGKYNYEVNIQPKNQKISDFKIKVAINESLPLDGISITRVKDKDEAKFQAEDISKGNLIYDEKNTPNVAFIDMQPNDAKNNGKDWKFVVKYDVKRPEDGNDVQIGAGKFVHYFAPDSLPTLPKHVIFVIDISGSMGGRKLQQTKDAMTTMLNKMSEKNIDNFNIILFDGSIDVWGRKRCGQNVSEDLNEYDYPSDYDNNGPWCYENDKISYSIPNNNGDVGPAYDFVLDLQVRGSTNINDALIEALNIAKQVKENEEIDTKTQQMIVFLTDGQPSAGETFGPKIKENVKKANAETNIPIYGLALGDGADFELIKDISDESNGFTERIYESGNSFEQLEDFYNKISDPKLRDVTFEYIVNGNRILPENLTTTVINQVFGSNEYSIAGKFPEDEDINVIKVIMKGKDQVGAYENIITLRPCTFIRPTARPKPLPGKIPNFPIPDRCFPIITPQPIWEQSPTEQFMERLWAYKRINYLKEDKTNCTKAIDNNLNDDNIPETTAKPEEEYEDENENDECEDEALRLALKYNFVTDLTSLVIEEDDDYINKGAIGIGKKPAPFYESQSYKASAFAYASAPTYGTRSSGGLQSFSAMSARRPSPQRRARPRPSYSAPPPSLYKSAPAPPRTYNQVSYDSYDSTTTQANTTTVTLGFCKMTMYDQTYFRGQSVEITEDLSDFDDLSFDDEVSSVKIEGDCCWTLYTDSNFQGVSVNLNVGEYQSPTNIKDVFKKASSAEARC